MTMHTEAYVVGPGRPPLHTRFKKGQSGNPSGKPGPAKQLKALFQKALYDALKMKALDLIEAKPVTTLDGVARELALGAMWGKPSAQRQLLKMLADDLIREEKEEKARAKEEEASDEPSFSAREENQTVSASLQQGEKQGGIENPLAREGRNPGDIRPAPDKSRHDLAGHSYAPMKPNGAAPLFLQQGEKQGGF